MLGQRGALRKIQHVCQYFLHLIRLERLGDHMRAPVLNWYCRRRVAGEEDERNAPCRQDGADRETGSAVEVDVQNCAV